MSRPFRFGVVAGSIGPAAQWATRVQRIEELGYATVLLPDTMHTPAPLSSLAAAAAATTHLHVGTWVLCEPLYHPPTLIREIGALISLFGDRVEIGLGAGRPDAEQDARALGLAYGSPGERVARLAETIALIRSAHPALKLLVAASGPRLLMLAARSADTVALGWPVQTDVRKALDLIQIVRDSADVIPEIAAGLVAVGNSGAPWLDRLALTVEQLAAQDAVTVLTGSPQQMADELERRRDQLGLSYLTIPEHAVEIFAPVLEILG